MASNGLIRCPPCGLGLPESEFGVCRARKNGRNKYCRKCAREKVYKGRRLLREYLAAKKRRSEMAVSPRKDCIMSPAFLPKSGRVIYALRVGFNEREAIRKATRLTPDEVSDQLALLYDSGKAKPVKGMWYLVA